MKEIYKKYHDPGIGDSRCLAGFEERTVGECHREKRVELAPRFDVEQVRLPDSPAFPGNRNSTDVYYR